jgi:hypothetical protein
MERQHEERLRGRLICFLTFSASVTNFLFFALVSATNLASLLLILAHYRSNPDLLPNFLSFVLHSCDLGRP